MSLDPEKWTEEEVEAYQKACDLMHEYLKSLTAMDAVNGTPTYSPKVTSGITFCDYTPREDPGPLLAEIADIADVAPASDSGWRKLADVTMDEVDRAQHELEHPEERGRAWSTGLVSLDIRSGKMSDINQAEVGYIAREIYIRRMSVIPLGQRESLADRQAHQAIKDARAFARIMAEKAEEGE